MSDRWDTESNHRLRQHLMRGISRNRNYSPDTSYADMQAGKCGPHTVQIAEVFSKHAAMWAEDQRELAKLEDAEDTQDLDGSWKKRMFDADAEVDRHLDAHKLPRYA